MNLLDKKTNQPSKFRRRNWVVINDESRGDYDDDNNDNNDHNSNNIKFKTKMIRSMYQIEFCTKI